jgi:hypothetical protein
MKAGDIIAFSGRHWISDVVNVGTYGIPRWSASHVGGLGHARDGRLLLFESTSLNKEACEITGKPIFGVQAHTLEKVVAAYQGRVWIYPLYRELYDDEDQRLTQFLMSTIGRPYDTAGAIRSGGLLLSTLEAMFRPEDLHSIYCSKEWAKAFAEIGMLPTDNAGRWSPNRLIRHLRRHEILLRPQRLK